MERNFAEILILETDTMSLYDKGKVASLALYMDAKYNPLHENVENAKDANAGKKQRKNE